MSSFCANSFSYGFSENICPLYATGTGVGNTSNDAGRIKDDVPKTGDSLPAAIPITGAVCIASLAAAGIKCTESVYCKGDSTIAVHFQADRLDSPIRTIVEDDQTAGLQPAGNRHTCQRPSPLRERFVLPLWRLRGYFSEKGGKSEMGMK